MGRVVTSVIAVAAIAVVVAGCGEDAPERGKVSRSTHAPDKQTKTTVAATSSSAPVTRRVDPRAGGLEVTMGEYSLELEAETIRPGPVTFVVKNRGREVHGFELKVERHGGSGHGGGDGVETQALRAGQSVRLAMTLAPGVYEVECFVDGHDDLGMKGTLTVNRGAPLQVVKQPAADASSIAISNFAFAPAKTTVKVGTKVTWVNHDNAPHTVTGKPLLDSPQLGVGTAYSSTFEKPGIFEYICALHPSMHGTIVVRA